MGDENEWFWWNDNDQFIPIMIDKFKKEVGFIRNSSSKKKIMRFSPSPSQSSDSFSSFEYDPRKERHE